VTDQPRRTSHARRVKYLLFSLVPALVLFGVIEIALRVFNFQYSNTPLEMRKLQGEAPGVIGFYDEEMGESFQKDSKQLWVPTKSKDMLLQFPEMKPDGVTRIVTLGDSCTAYCLGTSDSYPSLMGEIANQKEGRNVEILNAGVGSHSSFQGLQRLKHSALKYHPDVVTIFYGWNDHWATLRPDKEVKLPSDAVISVINFFEKFRIYQALNFIVTKYRASLVEEKLGFRVPLQDYEENLVSMVEMSRSNGAKPVLVTAPSYLADFKPHYLFPFPKEKLIGVHGAYNDVVRRVASLLEVPIADLANAFPGEEMKKIMTRDGIHYNPYGCRRVAEFLTKTLEEQRLL
jgi:lysophospholipase L1-like esterase